jgi:hypothetical protein
MSPAGARPEMIVLLVVINIVGAIARASLKKCRQPEEDERDRLIAQVSDVPLNEEFSIPGEWWLRAVGQACLRA